MDIRYLTVQVSINLYQGYSQAFLENPMVLLLELNRPLV